MIYALVALVGVVAWIATARISDPLRRTGIAIAAVGLILALAMWWMAFPFLIIAVVGGLIFVASIVRERSA